MKTAAVLLLAILTALRLWLAGTLTVTPLEAYYWLCAHRLDWAFFDGPAGTAWLVHLSSTLLGDGPLGLRLAFPLLAALASGGVFLLGRALFGTIAGIWAAVILNALPFFNIAAIHAGPELPALTFALFAAWAYVNAMDHGLAWWILGGLSLAVAAQFDYAALLLFPGVLAACTISTRHRAEWRRPGLYLAILLVLASLSPAWAWNRAHEWPSLALGTWDTALTPQWSEIGHGISTDFSLFSIFAIVGLACGIWALFREARIHYKPRLTLCLAAPFALLWIYDLLHDTSGSLGLLLAIGLIAGAVAHVFLENPLYRRIGAALLAVSALNAAFPVFIHGDPWSRSTGGVAWNEVAASLDMLLTKAQRPDKPLPLLIASDADATSALNYHLSRTTHPEVFLRESQDASNQFALWPRYDDFVETAKPADDLFKNEGSTTNPYMGRDALYLTEEEPDDLPQTITAAFVRVSPFASLELAGGRKMRVYLCEDYQTMPL